MGLFEGKKGVVVGIANSFSIAWSITQCLHEEGAVMGYTHLPDQDLERRKNEKKLRKLVEPLDAKFVVPCDVCSDEDLDKAFETTKNELGEIDFLVHSVAFAPPADLTGPTYNASREGYKLAMEISAYSLLAMAKRARPLMPNGGSILALTYFGGEEVIPGYNLMGICKAALECGVKYLASEMGGEGIRVNAISAGPIKTVSSSGVGDFGKMLEFYEHMAPLKRNVESMEVGKSAKYLLSDLSSGVTGEILHVDCGFSIMGAPPAVV